MTAPTGVGVMVGGAVAAGGVAIGTHGLNTASNGVDNLINGNR